MSSATPSSTPLLDVRGLRVAFNGKEIVHGIDFSLQPGEKVALVGESGSGKTISALSLLKLVEGAYTSGTARLSDVSGPQRPSIGRDLLSLSERELRAVRGHDIAMIFQEPMTALNPLLTIGHQITEVLQLKMGLAPAAAVQETIRLLADTGIPEPERRARAYPHQLSGGQRQRVMLAMALVNSPSLVICDEPTTALDVTVQAKVLKVLDEQLDAVGAACLFISHDLAVVSQVCHEVMVMWHGEIVERGTIAEVLGNPQHGYTKGLVATARLDLAEPGSRLPVVEDFWNPTETR